MKNYGFGNLYKVPFSAALTTFFASASMASARGHEPNTVVHRIGARRVGER